MSNNEYRIEELLTELGQCREDERNTQNQLLQILVTAAKILGILFGASFIDVDKILGEESAEIFSRVTFWASVLIFLAAFCYIAVLGMNNFLRYYYIQELEDRLRYLIPSADDDRKAGGPFLHWNSFQGPLITRNQKHIASHYTALHFASYTVALLCAVLFSIMLLVLEFLQIPTPIQLDYWGIVAAGSVMLVFLLRFFITASSARKIAEFARTTARKNLEARETGDTSKQYQEAPEFRRFLRYLIYPKSSDLQKPLLIIIGYIGGIVLSGRSLALEDCLHLAFVLIVFDVLAYQARYQINDIRGIAEDHGRLMPGSGRKPEYIKTSLMVAAGRSALAIFLAVVGPRALRLPLKVCLGILVVSTIVYEAARKTRSTWGVYILVGPGYPLRVLLGLWTAYPAFLRCEAASRWQFIFLGGALWAYGSFSSLLSWARQVSEKMKTEREKHSRFPESYAKAHFMALHNQIIERYMLSENRGIGQVCPLREQGKLSDPWTVWYLSALIFFCLALLLYHPSTTVMQVTEILAISFLGLAATDEHKGVFFYIALGNVLTVISGVASSSSGGRFNWYIYICILQNIVTMTYCFLRCAGQPRQGHLSLKICNRIGKLVIGSDAWKYVENAVSADQKLPRQ